MQHCHIAPTSHDIGQAGRARRFHGDLFFRENCLRIKAHLACKICHHLLER